MTSGSQRRATALVFLVGSLIALPSLSAQTAPLETRTLNHTGQVRTFRVYVPSSYVPGAPVPVVLGFHGGGGNAASFVRYGWNDTAERHGFLMVYPEGSAPNSPPNFILQTWNSGDCCVYASVNDIDDVGFVDAMLDAIAAEWTVDDNRIYATGFSNGGMMSYRLGVELAHRFAAIAPVGASLQFFDRPPVRPIPLIAMHGALDDRVPPAGGLGVGGRVYTSQTDSLAPFLIANGGQSLPSVPTRTVGQAQLFEANGPSSGADIHYWWLLDQGHSWPGQRASLNPGGPFNRDIDANEEIWSFFASHPRERLSVSVAAGCRPLGLDVPALSTTAPTLGTTMQVRLEDTPRGAAGQLYISLPGATPTLIAPQCTTPLDLASLVPVVGIPAGPRFDLALALPLDPALHGTTWLAQALWLQGSTVTVSNALMLRFAW